MEPKSWNIKGANKWHNVLNPIRNYIEKTIPILDKQIPNIQNRPTEQVNLSIGDPIKYKNFKTNPILLKIVAQGVGKIDGYTNFQGSIQARQALANFYSNSTSAHVGKDDIFLQFGGSLAIWMAIAVLADPGENFLFPEAGFPLGYAIASSLGIKVKFYKLKRQKDWEVDIESLEAQIDTKTKFLFVNNPSNPLGSVWSKSHKLEILDFCKKHSIPLVVDQIYQKMTFSNERQQFAELRGNVTVLKASGLTKRWLVPGWRVGWLIVYGGDETKEIRRGLKNLCDVLLMPHSVIQGVLPEILGQQSNEGYLNEKMQLLKQNQHYLSKEMQGQKYCTVSNSSGALYTTININKQYFNFPNTVQFCSKFYLEQNVMVFAGDFFFSEFFIRLVMCCDLETIKQFVVRFKRFCQRHIK